LREVALFIEGKIRQAGLSAARNGHKQPPLAGKAVRRHQEKGVDAGAHKPYWP